MSKRKPIVVVQGGQWGSEGKGMVAAALCKERDADVVVRTGTVNAGHTVYLGDRAFKMQQLPTSWVEKPNATMVLGAGAYICPEVLIREIRMVDEALSEYPDMTPGLPTPILIDRNCGLHLSKDHGDRSAQSGRHHSMGATGKGCSEAVIDKIRLRGTGQTTLFRQWWNEVGRTSYRDLEGRFEFTDTSKFLHDQYQSGRQVLIEGTQGSHLDLHLGPYPYTTHKQCQAAQWVQECGLGLGLEYEVVLVCRTYPIRVAGNSGPMPNELSWLDVADRINARLLAGRLPLRAPTTTDLRYWESAVTEAAKHYGLSGRMALDMHQWDAAMRIKCKVALSELHKEAMNLVPGPVQVRLKNLFEFTTVTQKLRRVADWDVDTVRDAIRWNGAETVVLSFFNYWYPELWNSHMDCLNLVQEEEYQMRLDVIGQQIGVPVSYVTTGPKTEHLIQTGR